MALERLETDETTGGLERQKQGELSLVLFALSLGVPGGSSSIAKTDPGIRKIFPASAKLDNNLSTNYFLVYTYFPSFTTFTILRVTIALYFDSSWKSLSPARVGT